MFVHGGQLHGYIFLPSSAGCWGGRIIIGKEKGKILENLENSFMTVGFVTISINGLIFCFIREYGCHVLFGVNPPSPGIGSCYCTKCWHFHNQCLNLKSVNG